MPSLAPIEIHETGLFDPMPQTKVISFADNGTSFLENLLDIVNPLQHIPVVSTIYRSITGDEIGTPARLIGGALFGGPIGFASVAANLMVEEASGAELASHALALFSDADPTPDLASSEAPPIATPLPSTGTASPPPALAATNAATPEADATIVWNGPRVLPPLARTAAIDPPVDGPLANATSGDAPPAGRIGRSPELNSTVRPAWLDAAIADAQSVQDTSQRGSTPTKVDGQPWITEAMLEALGKYQKLKLDQNRER